MKEEGFFESVSEVNITTSKNSTTMQSASTDNDIGLIMSLSMSLLGYWINDLTPRLKKGLKWNETCHQHYFVSKNSVAVESWNGYNWNGYVTENWSLDPFKGFLFWFRAYWGITYRSDSVELWHIVPFVYHISFLQLRNQVIRIIFRIFLFIEHA